MEMEESDDAGMVHAEGQGIIEEDGGDDDHEMDDQSEDNMRKCLIRLSTHTKNL